MQNGSVIKHKSEASDEIADVCLRRLKVIRSEQNKIIKVAHKASDESAISKIRNNIRGL